MTISSPMAPSGAGSVNAPATVQNLIGGRWRGAADGRAIERRNPARQSEIIALVPRSGPVDAKAAVDAATAAAHRWAATKPAERVQVLDRALCLLADDAETIAALDVRESGKTITECRSEVTRSSGTVRHQLELATTFGRRELTTPSGAAGVHWRVPVGVAAVITPWNFPFSVVLRKVMPALAAGNSVVCKPSELTPLTAVRIAEALEAAGLPAGAFNLVHGLGSEIGQALVADDRIGAISFTGSTGVGLGIAGAVRARPTKVQLEMGGKNAMVVLADADLDRAVDDAVRASLTAAGQWCVATSRVVLQESIAEEFTDLLVSRFAAVQVGDPFAETTEMGPVASVEQYEKVRRYIDAGGGRVLQTQPDPRSGSLTDGLYIAPTVVADVARSDAIANDEVFGPVVSLLRCNDLDDAIDLTNATRYGLSSSIYTRDARAAERFVSEVAAGRVTVNLPTNFGDDRIPSSGWKDSGRGEPEGALDGLVFYTHSKASFSLPADS